MEIKIQFRGNVYSICIGHETKWFWQRSFITVTQEWYEDKEVVHADMLYSS